MLPQDHLSLSLSLLWWMRILQVWMYLHLSLSLSICICIFRYVPNESRSYFLSPTCRCPAKDELLIWNCCCWWFPYSDSIHSSQFGGDLGSHRTHILKGPLSKLLSLYLSRSSLLRSFIQCNHSVSLFKLFSSLTESPIPITNPPYEEEPR